MEKISFKFLRLSLMWAMLLVFYLICRLIFIYVHQADLSIEDSADIGQLIFYGMRFDLSAIAITNSLFMILAVIPLAFTLQSWFKKSLRILFLGINHLALISNLVDVAYFPFIQKRSQSDIFYFISGDKGNDLYRLLPSFFMQYWYLILIYLMMALLMTKLYDRIASIYEPILPSKREWIKNIAFIFSAVIITTTAVRGGWQRKPLSLINASELTVFSNIPALINTPFSIIKSLDKKYLVEKNFYNAESNFYKNALIHHHRPLSDQGKKNIVIIIVESLSKKHLGIYGGRARTPFLDSIFSQGLQCTHAFANARESVQGIPAILASIPSWQSEPFIFSPYASNKITALPALLKAKNYTTAFFHGGFNGTMGFDAFGSMAGFDHYYGKNEYNNDADSDGHWGIWDAPFLQFMSQKLHQMPQPFMSTVFTLNPHHPFQLPMEYQSTFNKHRQPMLNCLEYVDYALRQFFNTIKKEPWFDNTLFVITADHTAPSLRNAKTNIIQEYSIPILFYQHCNDALQGQVDDIVNQIDIMPTILHMIGYDQPYVSIGKSILERANDRHATYYNGNVYGLINQKEVYLFNGEKGTGLYGWYDKHTPRNNKIKLMKFEAQHMDSLLKKDIQIFNHMLIGNGMHTDQYIQK